MKKLDSKTLERVRKILEANEEEKKAISSYSYDSKLINELLGSYIMNPSEAEVIDRNNPSLQNTLSSSSLSQDFYYFGKNKEEIIKRVEKIIKEIQDVYSAMYKNATEVNSEYDNYRLNLGRGSNVSLLGKDSYGFISTAFRGVDSKNYYQSAKFFASQYREGGILSKITLNPNIPHLCVEDTEDRGITDTEKECLISPFVEIEKDERASDFSNGMANAFGKMVKEEYVTIKPKDLRRLSKDEQIKIQDSLMKDIEQLEQKTVEYYILMKQYEASKSVDTYNKANECKTFILNWKTRFRQLMEAKCADIEKNIDNQIDSAIENPNKENKEQKNNSINDNRFETGRRNGSNITNLVSTSINRIINNKSFKALLDYKREMSIYGINPETQIDDLATIVQYIKSNVLPIEYINDEYNRKINFVNNGSSFADVLGNMEAVLNGKNVSELEMQASNEFKRAILEKVLLIRGNQELAILNKELLNENSKKFGVFGRQKKEQEKHKAQVDITSKIRNLNEFVAKLKENRFK